MKFYKMGHEEPEWPRSNLGSFELGAPDPTWFFLRKKSKMCLIPTALSNSHMSCSKY
jgi:hypothetical protein